MLQVARALEGGRREGADNAGSGIIETAQFNMCDICYIVHIRIREVANAPAHSQASDVYCKYIPASWPSTNRRIAKLSGLDQERLYPARRGTQKQDGQGDLPRLAHSPPRIQYFPHPC